MRRGSKIFVIIICLIFISSSLLVLHPDGNFGEFNFTGGLYKLLEKTGAEDLISTIIPGSGRAAEEQELFGEESRGNNPPFPVEERAGSWEFRIATSPSEVNPLVREAAEAIAGDSGPREAMQRIYDWITHNIVYDVEKYASGSPYVPDAVKTLQTKKGICGDYAVLAHEMLTAAELEAKIKTGEVVTDMGREKHVWNEVYINNSVYAFDSTWGSGHLSPGGQEFVRHPNPLFLTTPEKLKKLQTDIDYRKQKYQQWMREEALVSSPEYVPAYENIIINSLNRYRSDNNITSLAFCQELQKEARRLAVKISESECREENWSLDLQKARANLKRDAALAAKVYFYWGYPSPSPEKIFQGWIDEDSNRQTILSRDYNALGMGIVKRGDLLVVVKLLAHYSK